MTKSTDLYDALTALIQRLVDIEAKISDLQRLSGGASQETWKFAVSASNGKTEYILRRAPQTSSNGGQGIGLTTEAEVLRAVRLNNVNVPEIFHVCTPEDHLGSAFIMEFIEGETIPRKILRDERFAVAREQLASQCGETLALIHQTDQTLLPDLPVSGAREQIEQYEAVYRSFDAPRPVFELTLRWLKENVPVEAATTLVHGDFRNGNLMIDETGLRSVLDWELTHLGDPREDIGWICVNSWRFGHSDKRVGGLGSLSELLESYTQTSGYEIEEQEIAFWEVLGTLKWGIMCLMMYGSFASGADASIERAAIGRRSSETEIDLLNLLEMVA